MAPASRINWVLQCRKNLKKNRLNNLNPGLMRPRSAIGGAKAFKAYLLPRRQLLLMLLCQTPKSPQMILRIPLNQQLKILNQNGQPIKSWIRPNCPVLFKLQAKTLQVDLWNATIPNFIAIWRVFTAPTRQVMTVII